MSDKPAEEKKTPTPPTAAEAENFTKDLAKLSKKVDYVNKYNDIEIKVERQMAIRDITELLDNQQLVESLYIPNLADIMKMIEKNIFRQLPHFERQINDSKDTGIKIKIQKEPSWEYIKPIYDFFLKLLNNAAVGKENLKPVITDEFVYNLVNLFDSTETGERNILKDILYKLYLKIVPRRKVIRAAMFQQFDLLIYETCKFNGIAKLLDMYASIISGFAVPLKDEHKEIFNNTMVPLHKVQICHTFYEQLLRCSIIFLGKDKTLAVPLLEGLLKYWPFANKEKEPLFLTEIQEVLEVAEIDKIEHLIPKLFLRIANCLGGYFMKVSAKAMDLFKNKHFIEVFTHYKAITFPLLVPVINTLAENHYHQDEWKIEQKEHEKLENERETNNAWHQGLSDSVIFIQKKIKEIDPEAFEEAVKINIDEKKQEEATKRADMDQKWDNMNAKLASEHDDFTAPVLPFQSGVLVQDYNDLYSKIVRKEQLISQK